ncbi:slc44a5 [Symbiodinium necroappetens]|uniref:Slc44a5 protein n=1 Tax=Symbiodinium necroappetens TaxID=1628268 RepID=A0A813BTP8_9DINO|nr:slc44a5 [Symbiodinium necroappetens]
MGCLCCCCNSPKHDEEGKKFSKGGDNDLSNGPVASRGCTDVWCLIVLLAAWMAYIVVTVAGRLQDGAPAKLYLPRDYSGAYCDFEQNWNNGPNLKGFPFLSYTMNATATTDVIVKALLCSSASSDALQSLYSAEAYNEYLCDCCLTPCAKCEGSFDVGGDLDPSNLQGSITSKIGELKGAANPSNLFSGGGANGDLFTEMWSEATKYFNMVCLTSCNENFATMNASTDTIREWTYTMSEDDDLKKHWDALTAGGPAFIKDSISQFTFKALPESICPYNASKCIPFPGVEFGELYGGYCSFKMGAEVVAAMGQAASEIFESTGLETIGKWMGDFENSLPAFILVALCSFIIGFIYLVLLRFLIKFCVWFAVFLVFLMLVIGGGLCWIRSRQCQGAGLLETGQQMAVSIAVTAQTAADNAMSGTQAVSEAMTGDGADYRGVQTRTKNGYQCEQWGQGNAAAYNSSTYPNSGLLNNFCRNPYQTGSANVAATIWCFTTDTSVTWETCSPVGVIAPECAAGYAITNNEVRIVLEVVGYILWVIAGIYFILVCCLVDRIRLAIAVNQVAASFVKDTPRILIMPILQAMIGILWILLWALSASFLLSQVPEDYTPKEAFTSYDEAFGTANVSGKCTDKWPTGGVWKSESCDLVNGTYACWRCSPPRYVFDWRFAVSFFVFLWNNALNIAIGQCLIAGAVGIWFFTSNSDKGTKRVIAQSTWNVFRYHLGSLAFGSFIIAVIQFIRYLMKYYEKQAKAAKNRVLVLVLKVLQCCIWCFEKCVKFLNKNAYIQIALMGTNFCVSAKKAFFLILRNAFRFGTVAILGTMIHAIGFLFIIASSVALGYLILTGLYPDIAPAVCLIIYGCTAYVVSKLFMNVFGLAVDTTLQCFIACEEMELGGDFVPSSMSRWLDKSKPIVDEDD